MKKRNLLKQWHWLLPALLLAAMTLPRVATAAPIGDPDFTTPIVNPADIQKYFNPLPNAFLLKVNPDTTVFAGEDYYHIDTGQFNHDMGLFLTSGATGYTTVPASNPAKVQATPSWGYGFVSPTAPAGTAGAYTFPGPTIVNTQGRPTRVTWTNSLPAKHVVGVDPTLSCTPPPAPHAGAINAPQVPYVPNAPNCAPENRIVVHTHGAHVWDDSDGDPLAWFSNGFAKTGETWKPNTQHGKTNHPSAVGTYRYINDQEAGTIWYHDHAMGLTHLNVYAGMAGFFLITDANEKNLQNTGVLPTYSATAPYEIPIALQDRKFYTDGRLAIPDLPVLDITATLQHGSPGAGAIRMRRKPSRDIAATYHAL